MRVQTTATAPTPPPHVIMHSRRPFTEDYARADIVFANTQYAILPLATHTAVGSGARLRSLCPH